jgi:four helix bundle protein
MQQNSLEALKVYQSARTIAEDCWMFVSKWDSFAKQTLGNQLVRAADSIAANISEGYGRYSFKENKLFCYYARGSRYMKQEHGSKRRTNET